MNNENFMYPYQQEIIDCYDSAPEGVTMRAVMASRDKIHLTATDDKGNKWIYKGKRNWVTNDT